MTPVRSIREKTPEPIPMETHALDNLRYIRETMEHAGSFTAVPGWGFVAMGITAVAAALVARWQTTQTTWLATWLIEGAVALAVGLIALDQKARATGVELWSAPARKFTFSFVPPMLAGATLTFALWQAGIVALIPGTWLLLYGTGVITAGVFSIRIVPLMGACFVILGGLALFAPLASSSLWLGLGFGGLHLFFGGMIARKHGG